MPYYKNDATATIYNCASNLHPEQSVTILMSVTVESEQIVGILTPADIDIHLEIARSKTIELLKAFPKSKHRRLPVKETMKNIIDAISQDGVRGWASTLIISRYGVEWGSYLLANCTNIFALAKCCLRDLKKSEYDDEAPSFMLWGPATPVMPAEYVATGLPTGSIEISCNRLGSGNWEFNTSVFIYWETLTESIPITTSVEVVSSEVLQGTVDGYMERGYTLMDAEGCDMEVPLVEYLKV